MAFAFGVCLVAGSMSSTYVEGYDVEVLLQVKV